MNYLLFLLNFSVKFSKISIPLILIIYTNINRKKTLLIFFWFYSSKPIKIR